jgi:putative acetyltransferase
MNIRPETPSDYAAITEINIRAFDQRLSEALIVALHRQRPRFDPELSLVAEIDGRIVGHVLFTPHTIRLLGQDMNVVILAPIAVDPLHQKAGIGGKLIEEGHRIAREKGYALSFLIGHPEYYPRFGYKTGVYAGVSSVDVTVESGIDVNLETRKPLEADIGALKRLWLHEEGEVDFAIVPGDSLMDWLSPNPQIDAAVYLREGEIIGYTRIHQDEPTAPRVFLAKDGASAQTIAAKIGATKLPLHPNSASASVFGQPAITVWGAEMACPLSPSIFDEFYGQLQGGERFPGRVIWGMMFDL